jgi:hypothetical protein
MTSRARGAPQAHTPSPQTQDVHHRNKIIPQPKHSRLFALQLRQSFLNENNSGQVPKAASGKSKKTAKAGREKEAKQG